MLYSSVPEIYFNQTVSVACVNLTNCNQKLLITFGDDQMPLFCELSTRLVYSSPGFSEEIADSDNRVVISEQLIAVMVKPEKKPSLLCRLEHRHICSISS